MHICSLILLHTYMYLLCLNTFSVLQINYKLIKSSYFIWNLNTGKNFVVTLKAEKILLKKMYQFFKLKKIISYDPFFNFYKWVLHFIYNVENCIIEKTRWSKR